MPVLQPGQVIKDYRIINQIGKGGMASVFKAYQASMGRFVAIKVLSFQLANNDEFLGRFKQEARLVALLEHPNILPVYDYGEEHGVPYFVMRYLDAGTLKNRLQGLNASGSNLVLPLEEVDNIFSQLCEALGYAHENGVIHRDIKPSNIMLDRRGSVFITDFGVAKALPLTLVKDGLQHRQEFTIALEFTATGAVTGTPDYMSPEQARGLKLDQRSDIYSLGIVLFEMLTGKVPFEAETPMAVIMKQITDPLPPPSQIRPGINPLIEALLQKALAKDPEARFSSMALFKAAWKRALAESLAATGAPAQPAAPQFVAPSPAEPAPSGGHTPPPSGLPAASELALPPTPAPKDWAKPGSILHGMELDPVVINPQPDNEARHEADRQMSRQADRNPLASFRQGEKEKARESLRQKTASRKFILSILLGIIGLLTLIGVGWAVAMVWISH